MGRIPATKFRARCLELIDRVAERREGFVITKQGRPVAMLVPVDRKPKDSRVFSPGSPRPNDPWEDPLVTEDESLQDSRLLRTIW